MNFQLTPRYPTKRSSNKVHIVVLLFPLSLISHREDPPEAVHVSSGEVSVLQRYMM